MRPLPKRSLLRALIILVAAASLAACLIAPLLLLLGRIDEWSYKSVLLAGSIGWFVCAAALAFGRGKTGAVGKT